MILQVALVISVVLQFVAFVIVTSLIPKTRYNIAWISIALGFFLMAIRRLADIFNFYYADASSFNGWDDFSSWIAVFISIAMLISSIFIRKIFEVINRIQKLRKENEAKLLSAIISTEETERKHFAKELHDGLGPVLSSAKMTLSAIDKSEIDDQNSILLKKAEQMVDNAIVSTKEISNHLTPHILERYGLKKAIDTFIRNLTNKETVNFSISSNIEKKRYSNHIEVILYRICCELINNSLKYASASNISILLTDSKNSIELKYDDNGKGFDISEKELKGMGIMNIKSRVKSLNGIIEMRSTPGNGFFVNIKLPL